MHEAVEAFPVLADFDEEGVDLRVVGDVARENQFAVEFVSELADPLDKSFVLIGEGQLRAFAMAGFGDAVGDGMLGQHAGDENAFVCQKSHGFSCVPIRFLSGGSGLPDRAL